MPFQLPTLPIGGLSGSTPEQQQIWWQQVVEAIEAEEASQNDALAAIQTLQTQQAAMLDDLADKQDQLDAQLAQIIQAQADATAAARETARLNSYPSPGVGILHAADVGSDVTITVDNHTRVYPVQGSIDVPDVAITGGTVTGQPFSTRIYVYYDDTTLANATPTFLATTTSATAQVGAAAGRHFLGYVDTPADGGAATGGTGGGPPGGGGGGTGGAIP